jgi:hypothetical protein
MQYICTKLAQYFMKKVLGMGNAIVESQRLTLTLVSAAICSSVMPR